MDSKMCIMDAFKMYNKTSMAFEAVIKVCDFHCRTFEIENFVYCGLFFVMFYFRFYTMFGVTDFFAVRLFYIL